jgi:hypothetical protein
MAFSAVGASSARRTGFAMINGGLESGLPASE